MKSQWALITGASAGIGEATALALAAQGCNLFLVARREDRLQKIKADIDTRFQVQVEVAPLNIVDKAARTEFVRSHEKLLHKISILINNAGLALTTDPMQNARFEDWETMVQTNVLGLLHLTRLLLPSLLKQPQAHIVNLGSVAGRWVYPGGAVYAATKFAVRAISEGLRMDLLGHPVRVTNIEPGMVETEFSQVRLKDAQKAKSVYQGMTPLRAADIADAIVWSLSRPAHVNIAEMVIYPTEQAGVGLVHRQT